MNTLEVKIDVPFAQGLLLTEDTLSVDLSDGRSHCLLLEQFCPKIDAETGY
jgi:hypothetical protein